MRSLEKAAEPQILVENGTNWTAEYVAASTPAERKARERWRHPDIRDSLKWETAGKCAYCESFVDDVAYPHVEHIVPKTARRDLAHDWANLTRACPICNVNKSDYYDSMYSLLNPYTDNIEEHLSYFGDFVDWEYGDVRAELTIKRIGLNRLELMNSRGQRLVEIRELLERWATTSEPLKSALDAAIRVETVKGQYSGTVAAYLRSRGFPL